MRGIKIPQKDCALKMPGGLCARGGVFAGHYGSSNLQYSPSHPLEALYYAFCVR